MPSMFKSKPRSAARAAKQKRNYRESSSEAEWLPSDEQKDTSGEKETSKIAQNTRSAVEEDTSMDVDGPGVCLRLSIDCGTTFSKASFQFFNPADATGENNVSYVQWQSHVSETPSVVAYINGRLICGEEVEIMLRNHELSESKVLRQFKLALTSDHRVQYIRDHVLPLLQSEGKTLQDLFVDYTKELFTSARSFISGTHEGLSYGVDTIPCELLLSVPQAWQPQFNLALINSAKKLGVKSCKIVGEALSVAACMLKEEIDKSMAGKRWLNLGDHVIVLDLGGGTGDFVAIELTDPLANGARLGMRVVRPASGDLCGAVFINKNFTTWLKDVYFPRQEKNLNAVAGSLGFTCAEDFLAAASVSFEEAKKTFPRDTRYNVFVRGKAEYIRHWDAEVSKTEMQSFFDPVVDAIDKQVDLMLEDPADRSKLKCFIISGGLGKSQYIIKHMEQKWKDSGIRVLNTQKDHRGPVAEGAILRYGSNLLEPFNENWSFCVVRSEDFDPALHPDAAADPALIHEDPVDSSDIVLERCIWIRNGNTGSVKEVWTQHYPTVIKKQPIEICVQIFWSTRQDISDHEPLLEPLTDTIRPGMQLFHEVKKTIINHKSMGWSVVKPDKLNESSYELMVCAVMRVEGDMIRFGLKVVDRNAAPFDEDGNLLADYDESRILWEDDEFTEIWDRRFSQVATETDAGVIMPAASRTGAHSARPTKRVKDETLFLEDDEEIKPNQARA